MEKINNRNLESIFSHKTKENRLIRKNVFYLNGFYDNKENKLCLIKIGQYVFKI